MLNKLKEMRESREEGFTLIELLVVIVIIGVLAAIALPIFLNQQKAAIAGGVKSDVRNTVAGVATYLVKNPTATTVAASIPAGASPTATGLAAGANPEIKIVKSDANTAITVAGAWDTYTVTGTNSGLVTGSSYVFDSTTGKYTGSNDLR